MVLPATIMRIIPAFVLAANRGFMFFLAIMMKIVNLTSSVCCADVSDFNLVQL